MTLAARLLFIIALALLPPLLIQVWTGMEQRQAREDGIRTAAIAQTRAVQGDVARMTEGVRQLLVALSGVPAIREGDAATCSTYLALIARQSHDYILLGANDADGTIICNSAGTTAGGYSNAGRAYHQRSMASQAFSAGDLVSGVATRRVSIHFALPFRRRDDAPGGIVFAGIDQERLVRQLEGAALPPGATAVMLDPAGNVIADVHPGQDGASTWLGKQAPQALRAVLEATAPGVAELAGPDGRTRLFGVVPPDPSLSGIRVTVGFDPERATADIRAATWQNAAALLAGVALAFGAGTLGARRLVLGPLGRLLAAADRPGPAPPRPRALAELGATLDRMSSARDRAEAARREEGARYKALFEAIDAGFCILEMKFGPDGRAADYRFLEINPAFAAQTGLENAQGKWILDLVPDLERHWFDMYGRVATTGEPAKFESPAEPMGRWYTVNAFRVGEPGQHRVAALFTDITDRRRAEEIMRQANEGLEARVAERTAELRHVITALHEEALEREDAEARLRQSQKMEAVGQLTGGIAHDFNNMLQGISASLELLRRRVAQGRVDDAARFLESAALSVERAAALTNRLLAFARRQSLDARPVDPDALVHGIEELIRRTLPPSIGIRLETGVATWSVRCDPNQLESGLLNLAINARDAMPDGGMLTIVAADVLVTAEEAAHSEGAETGEYVAISVADSGTGMDEAVQARAFEPFFTTKPMGQGTGLGLSQIYGFVRQSGGFVRLVSAPGAGTTVTLYLPRYEGVVRPASSMPVGAPAACPGTHVLLVEDDPTVRAGAAEHLRELGYSVLEAGDGAAALELLRHGPPVKALVTDVGLPGGLNGRQLAEAVRAERPGLPVLFITGYAAGALDERLDPGMAMLGKPFTLDALAGKLAGLLAHA